MKNLTAIYWIKNETPYLPEWIEFHLIQGFDYFILYDNESNDGLYDIMKPYLDQKILEIRKYPEHLKNSNTARNYWAMEYCIQEQREKSKWIHFHAIDEFTYCPDGRKVSELLKEFEQFGGLAVNWKLFGTNGHIEKPEGLVIENYTKRLKYDRYLHVKTIIQPEKTHPKVANAHWFYTDTVDENYNPVQGPFNVYSENLPFMQLPKIYKDPIQYTFNKIANNHYITKSQKEFDEKYNKGVLDAGANNENVKRRIEDAYDNFPNDENAKFNGGWVEDTDILKFCRDIKINIKNRYDKE